MIEGTQRKLTATVFAHMVGYSRLMAPDKTGTLAAMRDHCKELWNPTIEIFGGRIVGTADDSILVEFASTVAAVESSIAARHGFAQSRSAGSGYSRIWELSLISVRISAVGEANRRFAVLLVISLKRVCRVNSRKPNVEHRTRCDNFG